MKFLPAAAIVLMCFPALAGSLSGKEADTLFRSGMAAAAEGRNNEAIENFRHLLRGVPSPRVKLELARVLLKEGRYRESLSLFREVYKDSSTPMAVKRNILPFMEEAELRVVRVRYGIRAVSDNNPSRVSEGGTIYFNGIPMEYQPPAAKRTSYGAEPWLSVERLWENGYLTRFNTSAKLYEERELRSGLFKFSTAKRLDNLGGVFIQGAVETEIWDDTHYVMPSVEAWKRVKLSDRAGVGFGAQFGYMSFDNEEISGPYYRSYAFGDWTFRPNATAFANISVEHLNSSNDHYSYYTPAATLGISFKIGGAVLTPAVTAKTTRFVEYDPFFGVTRKDVTLRPSVSFSHDRIEWNGIKPALTLFHEERDSNIDIYDYKQTGGFISFTRSF